MDRTLPNGVIVRNVNPAISEQDFKEQVIAAGYVTSEDYDRDMKTNADMVSAIAEAGGGVAGAGILYEARRLALEFLQAAHAQSPFIVAETCRRHVHPGSLAGGSPEGVTVEGIEGCPMSQSPIRVTGH